jgi:hypothetical protein
MKKLIYLFVCAILISGCANKTTPKVEIIFAPKGILPEGYKCKVISNITANTRGKKQWLIDTELTMKAAKLGGNTVIITATNRLPIEPDTVFAEAAICHIESTK